MVTQVGLHCFVKRQGVDDCAAFGFETLHECFTVLIASDNQYLHTFNAFVFDEGRRQGVAVGLFRGQVDLEVVLFDFACSRGSDRGDAHRAQAAYIVKCFIEKVKERLYAISAGKDDPLIDCNAR